MVRIDLTDWTLAVRIRKNPQYYQLKNDISSAKLSVDQRLESLFQLWIDSLKHIELCANDLQFLSANQLSNMDPGSKSIKPTG